MSPREKHGRALSSANSSSPASATRNASRQREIYEFFVKKECPIRTTSKCYHSSSSERIDPRLRRGVLSEISAAQHLSAVRRVTRPVFASNRDEIDDCANSNVSDDVNPFSNGKESCSKLSDISGSTPVGNRKSHYSENMRRNGYADVSDSGCNDLHPENPKNKRSSRGPQRTVDKLVSLNIISRTRTSSHVPKRIQSCEKSNSDEPVTTSLQASSDSSTSCKNLDPGASSHDYSETAEKSVSSQGDDGEVTLTQEEDEVKENLRSLSCSQEDGNEESSAHAQLDISSRAKYYQISSNDVSVTFAGTCGPSSGTDVVTRGRCTGDATSSSSSDVSTSSKPLAEEDGTDGRSSDPDYEDSSRINYEDDDVLMTPMIGTTSKPSCAAFSKRSIHSENIRRSTRLVTRPDRFKPLGIGFRSKGESVFTKCRDRRHTTFRKLPPTHQLLQANESRKKREEALTELRREAERDSIENKSPETDERAYAKMVEQEQSEETHFLLCLRRYECPLPFFSQPMNSLAKPLRMWNRSRHDFLIHPLLDILGKAKNLSSSGEKCGRDFDFGDLVSMDMVSWTLSSSTNASCASNNLMILAEMLFHETVFDDTPADDRCQRRHALFLLVLEIISRSRVSTALLPSLCSVLKEYGGDFESSLNIEMDDHIGTSFAKCNSSELDIRTKNMAEESLDYDVVVNRDGAGNSTRLIASRNLRRALCIYRRAVQVGMEFSCLVGADQKSRDLKDQSCRNPEDATWNRKRDEEPTLNLLALCTRLMVSPFGSQLFREAGALISAVVERVSTRDWPSFRLKAAKIIVRSIHRLGLQVELVTYLFPFLSSRCRFLQLDSTFFLAKLWCSGSTAFDGAISDNVFEPSSDAVNLGLEALSFTLSDVLAMISHAPELTKETDTYWARGLMRLLKQVVGDEDVLSRHQGQNLCQLVGAVKKLRKSCKRMGDGVSVQDMRIALDSLRYVIDFYARRVQQSSPNTSLYASTCTRQASLTNVMNYK